MDLRNGDKISDLYYESPYINRVGGKNVFSSEKDSANKENVSPYSGGICQQQYTSLGSGTSGTTHGTSLRTP